MGGWRNRRVGIQSFVRTPTFLGCRLRESRAGNLGSYESLALAWHLLFPLTSSLLYVFSAMFLKRAAALGARVLLTTVVVHFVTAITFLAALPLGGTMRFDLFWQPLVVGLLYVLGQATTFLALKVGDVSVATPVMGVKSVIVALLATFVLREEPPWQLWLAAVLSATAIALLNVSGREKHRVLTTSFWAFASAFCYSLFDVFVQKWAPEWGTGRFLPTMTALAAVPVLLTWGAVNLAQPAEAADVVLPPRGGGSFWPWLLAGAGIMAFQALLLTGAIAYFGDATAINIVYSARGLWAVGLVMLVGQWFRNEERQLAPRILRARMCGAVVMTVAIVIALVR